MKNLIVFYDSEKNLRTELQDIPVPSDLGPNEVLIKVEAAGSNPKDWKHPLPEYFNNKLNQGDDCAGTIADVGSTVKGFNKGDRVAGFHEMDTPRGTYAEYTVCPSQTVFRIPDSMSYEEAATMPLAIFTAAVGLYRNLDIPSPWDRSDEKAAGLGSVALIVNAASSAVGSFAIKLAKLNPRISPIIAVAGASADYVRSLDVDAVVDYRSATVVEDIQKAANGVPIKYIFDAANTLASTTYLTAVIAQGGRYTCTTPFVAHPLYEKEGKMLKLLEASGAEYYEQIWCGDVYDGKKAGGNLFGCIMSSTIEQALGSGKLQGHPSEVVEGGLDGVLGALQSLRERSMKSGNAKFVTRIADTASLRKE